MDMVYGIAALVLLVVGFVRVFHTEKGSDYYFESGAFLVKLALFIIVGLLSIYPTIKFMGWRKALREGRVPDFDAGTRRKVRMLIHIELTLLFVIMLMADHDGARRLVPRLATTDRPSGATRSAAR